jgi:hypothetical protein
MDECPWSRIDIIGQNGNDGDHYAEVPLSPPEKPANESLEDLDTLVPDPPEAA